MILVFVLCQNIKMEELLESMFLSTPLIRVLNDRTLKFFSESSVVKKEVPLPPLHD